MMSSLLNPISSWVTIWSLLELVYQNLNTSLDGEILLNAKIRASKWKELNPNNKKKENISQEIPIFQLSINHGKNIQNGEYAYIVYLENEFTTNKI